MWKLLSVRRKLSDDFRVLWSTCSVIFETCHIIKPESQHKSDFWHRGPHRLHGEVVQPGRGQIGWSWGEAAYKGEPKIGQKH